MSKTSNPTHAGGLCQLTAMETNLGGNDSTHTKISHNALAIQQYYRLIYTLACIRM